MSGSLYSCRQGNTYYRHFLGGRLKLLRERRGLSQQQIAEQLEVDQSWISRLEAGKVPAEAGQIRTLCLLLDVDPALLLDL
jgi:transcriptional regulator with XRE-family HTH domain